MDNQIQPVLMDLILNDEEFKKQVKFDIKKYKPQDKILQKGKIYKHLCFLRKGTVKVVLSDEIEKALHPIVSDIYPNEIFGGMGALHSKPANADVIAVTEAEIVEINIDSLQSYIVANPETGNKLLIEFISILFDRINHMNDKLFSVLKHAIKLQKTT